MKLIDMIKGRSWSFLFHDGETRTGLSPIIELSTTLLGSQMNYSQLDLGEYE